MFPVSYKKALKKMLYYNKGKHIAEQPETAQPSGGPSETHDVLSIEEGGQLDLPTLPSSYFESQKGIGESIDRAETFSPTSMARFQKWVKGTEISLAQAELQQQSYHNVHTRIQEAAKRKSKSRRVNQKGGVITVENARLRQQEKAEQEKAAAIKRAQKHIETSLNKAKAALNRRGISAGKAEKQKR